MNDTPAEREDISIWAKLRRRRVAQWALAYAAGAWVLLQVLGFVSDSFAWPATVKQVATIILAVGLPIVVVLGWYHGERGQRRVSGPELAVLTLLLLIGGGLLWLHSQRSVPTTTTATAETPAPVSAAVDGRPSIAVLPFDNRSRLEDDAFFVDGIHDDILTQLSKVSALRVISRTSVEQFRDTKLPVKAIADQLGVTKILEGGVQRAGDRVRVTVQLIDAATDAHLWAEKYDRELSAANIFAIQSEVAAAIAGALKASLTPSEQAWTKVVPTQNLEAWEAYQLGRQRLAKRTSAALTDAEQFFRKATNLDPKFALAWAGLADTFLLQTLYSGRSPDAGLRDAEHAATKALEMEPNLAEAWTSAAGIANERQQFDRSEEMFRRAIELNPNYAPAHQWLSGLLFGLGRSDEALQEATRVVVLDPLSAVAHETLGTIQELLGRHQEAEASYRKTLTIDPLRPNGFWSLSFLNAYAFNRFSVAVPLMEKAVELDPESPRLIANLAALHFDVGEDNKSFEVIARAVKRWPEDVDVQYASAVASLVQQDSASALEHAQRAIDVYSRLPLLLAILCNADLKNNRHEAAFERYERSYPELLAQGAPRVDGSNYEASLDLARVLRRRDDSAGANALLDGAGRVIRTVPRLGWGGHGITDVQIQALRGQKAAALAALREAERAGWRRLWRYHRDHDANLASIRGTPEFKAIFADIERDMTQQRAALAARPKDAPLELSATTH